MYQTEFQLSFNASKVDPMAGQRLFLPSQFNIVKEVDYSH